MKISLHPERGHIGVSHQLKVEHSLPSRFLATWPRSLAGDSLDDCDLQLWLPTSELKAEAMDDDDSANVAWTAAAPPNGAAIFRIVVVKPGALLQSSRIATQLASIHLASGATCELYLEYSSQLSRPLRDRIGSLKRSFATTSPSTRVGAGEIGDPRARAFLGLGTDTRLRALIEVNMSRPPEKAA